MDPNQVLTAATSLLAAAIGAAAVLAAQHTHWKREASAASEDRVKHAVQEVLVKELSIDLQAHEFALLSMEISSASGLLSRLLGTSAPVDLPTIFRTLNVEAEALNRASAYIWMNSDQRTIALTNDVVLTAMDVVEAHYSPRIGSRIVRFLRELFLGRRPGDPAKVEATRQNLAAAREALAGHMRMVFDLPAVEFTENRQAEPEAR